jgi:hypothetical protein
LVLLVLLVDHKKDSQCNVTAFINHETHGEISQEAFLEMTTVSSWAIVSAAKRMAAWIGTSNLL